MLDSVDDTMVQMGASDRELGLPDGTVRAVAERLFDRFKDRAFEGDFEERDDDSESEEFPPITSAEWNAAVDEEFANVLGET